jgi:hypothetical protein
MANELTGQFLRPDQGPLVDQLEEYRELMTGIVRTLHKGVKVTARFPGTEFMLPGSFTEWSMPDADDHIRIERDRTYSASYKHIGMGAHKLVVLESESVLIPNRQRYTTHRRIFRFGWANKTVYDSQAIHTEIISEANSAVSAIDVGGKAVTVSEPDEHNDPFRYSEHILADESDVDCLLYRTERYSKAYLAHLRQDYYDELAS